MAFGRNYKDSDSGKKKAAEAKKPTKDGGKGDGKDDMAKRHMQEREDTHQRHSKMRDDMHKQHQEELAQMAERQANEAAPAAAGAPGDANGAPGANMPPAAGAAMTAPGGTAA